MSSSGITFEKISNKQNKGKKDINNLNNSKYDKKSHSRKSLRNRVILSNSKYNSHRETLLPVRINTSKNKNNCNSNTFTQFNNYQKCSITNNNILLKFDEYLLNKDKKNYFNEMTLSTTSADSFFINSSYKNINQLTEGEYIRDKKFQKDAIKFLKDYRKNKDIKYKIKKNFSSNEVPKISRKGTNFFNLENSMMMVKHKMTYYLKQNIKLFKKRTMNSRRNSKSKRLDIKRTKIEGAFNNISINSSINSINNKTNILNPNSRKLDIMEKLQFNNTHNENYDDS
jgi:hypothetical protein